MTELPKNVSAWLICMEDSVDRHNQMKAQLEKFGIGYTWFKAINGKEKFEELSHLYDADAYRRNMGQDLLPGKVGCYQSHLQVWREFLKSDAEYALIFEDDIVLHDDFLIAVNTALSNADLWDTLRFNAIRAKFPINVHTIAPYEFRVYAGPFTGNGTYLIKRDIAERLLQNIPMQQRALDHELNRFFAHDFRQMGLEPFASHPDDGGNSTITGTGFSKVRKPKWTKRLPHYRLKAANYFRRIWWLLRRGYLLSNPVARKSDQ